MNFTDTHCHLYHEQFSEDIEEVISRAKEAGVQRFLLPAIDSNYSKAQHQVVTEYQNVFTMHGLHPCSVGANWEQELEHVQHNLFNETPNSKLVAVGEIGIDLYWDKTFLQEQTHAFKIQIDWAKKLELPIVIHVREAFDEVFTVLDELNDDRLKGVFHCFTGNLNQAQHILSYGGFMLGIGGVLTFKNAGLDKVIKEVDLNHLVLETDSPYLAPHPNRGKRNEPAYIELIAKKLSHIKSIPVEEIAQITERNTNKMFF